MSVSDFTMAYTGNSDARRNLPRRESKLRRGAKLLRGRPTGFFADFFFKNKGFCTWRAVFHTYASDWKNKKQTDMAILLVSPRKAGRGDTISLYITSQFSNETSGVVLSVKGLIVIARFDAHTGCYCFCVLEKNNSSNVSNIDNCKFVGSQFGSSAGQCVACLGENTFTPIFLQRS